MAAIGQDRVLDRWIRLEHALDQDQVLPVLAEVVTAHESVDSARQQVAKFDVVVAVQARAAGLSGVKFRGSVNPILRFELMQMVAQPVEHCLDDIVQAAQTQVGGP